MPKSSRETLGVLPSLEVLPFFAEEFQKPDATSATDFQLQTFASYGEIARKLLTRQLTAGVLPWEIFVADVLALPGQRNLWKITIFVNACPTELVLCDRLHKAFYPTKLGARPKLPTRLTVGIESQNSLTKLQALDWLSHWKGGSAIDLQFKMLPVDLMMQALEADALDAVIAAAPWGMHAESAGFGKRDPRFVPGKSSQLLVMASQKEIHDHHPGLSQEILRTLATARADLATPNGFLHASSTMAKRGKPVLPHDDLALAAALHDFPSLNHDRTPDLPTIVAGLLALDAQAFLPPQVAANEQTARLLLPG
ncbi:MAG: hypothetical protein V4640_08850 [Verrucomicrobiota bacterium]